MGMLDRKILFGLVAKNPEKYIGGNISMDNVVKRKKSKKKMTK